MIFPSLVIITIIAAFFKNFQEYKVVQHAFAGIQIAVIALIADVVVKMWKRTVKDIFGFLVFVPAFILLIFSGFLP